MPAKPRVRLIHWDAPEASERVATLRAAGYVVDASRLTTGNDLKAITARPPAAVVVDLGRMPTHGRDVGVFVRHTKATRHVPLVFVEGEPEKVEKVRAVLPDATFTSWPRIRSALRAAIAKPPANPVTLASNLAGYSGTPLPKKLAIKPGSRVALIGAPQDFEATLGTLPEGAVVTRQFRGTVDLAIWFVRSERDYRRDIARMAAATPRDGLWIAWPKQASGVATDVTQPLVREVALANGIV
ncbi:MAG: hypothetical protein ACRDHK_12265, partial [Actinomycetota bacterium]